MKRIFFGILVFVLVLSIGAIAISAEIAEGSGTVGEQVLGYVGEFVSQRGIDSEKITGVREVDFNELPKEVAIENVGDTNLAIYEINYSEKSNDKKIYVVTYSVEKLRSQGDLIVAQDKRNFLDFGHQGIMNDSWFLETSAGVETSEAKGYVMMRDGSVTAISTNLEIIQGNPGQIDIIVLRNGEMIGFGNTFSTDSIGVKKDYDVQAKEVVNFEAGDVISVVVRKTGYVSWRDVITLIEITTEN